jgi:hypothetical protein
MGGEAMPLSLAALNMTLNETLQLLKDLQLPSLEMVESEAVQAALVALYSVTGAAALLLNALQIYILCTGRRFVSSTTYLYSSMCADNLKELYFCQHSLGKCFFLQISVFSNKRHYSFCNSKE